MHGLVMDSRSKNILPTNGISSAENIGAKYGVLSMALE